MKLSKKDIELSYRKIKKQAIGYCLRKKYDKALEKIVVSALVAYTFNFVYSDSELESLLRYISASVIRPNKKTPLPNRVVFYDSFGLDHRNLTQQYIRALKKADVDFLFIYEKKDNKYSLAIDKDLSTYRKVQVYELDQSLNKIEQIRKLYSIISDYAPSKAFLQIEPWSVIALSVFYAFPEIVKYNINLTDHAFWLGNECIDYNIEFRNYGYTVSVKKRELKPEQCICLPYYPLINDASFKGFPVEVLKKNVVLFSGGSFYKIYGEHGAYFNIVKRLLNDNPNIVIMYAGDGERNLINSFIKKNGFENRLWA